MPTLQFKGKNIIWNHHLAIPYHTLDENEKLAFRSKKAGGNLIVEGDNLLALKALLPQYAGKVKCIYIDPPYNTGNEGWVYNDNVNSPLLQEWLGKEVGKDDLTRHDKWLCMMVPRLKLLRELLADDGAIFISIDDNEQHSLRAICDEIFGELNFVANILWQKKYSTANDHTGIAPMHDFLLVYRRSELWQRGLLPRTEEKDRQYRFEDEKGVFRVSDYTCNKTAEERPNLYFPIINPNTGKEILPKRTRVWAYSEEAHQENEKKGLVYWGEDGKAKVPGYKRYLADLANAGGIVPNTWWDFEFAGHTDAAKKEARALEFGENGSDFSTPKPTQLIKQIMRIGSDSDSIILDSFAGSGTTMQAVMDLNKEDGGNRQCILVQMTEATKAEPKRNICKDITRERVKRAIEKYGYDSGFQYMKVGIPLDAETLLSGTLPTYKQFAEYVYYLCTGESLKNKKAVDEKTFFVAEHGKSVIYLVYKRDFDELTRMALNLTLAEAIRQAHPKKRAIVYAPACFLEEDYMRERNIEFVGIPYSLFQRTEA